MGSQPYPQPRRKLAVDCQRSLDRTDYCQAQGVRQSSPFRTPPILPREYLATRGLLAANWSASYPTREPNRRIYLRHAEGCSIPRFASHLEVLRLPEPAQEPERP